MLYVVPDRTYNGHCLRLPHHLAPTVHWLRPLSSLLYDLERQKHRLVFFCKEQWTALGLDG